MILAFSGSGRASSTNEKILNYIASQSEGRFDLEIFSGLADLPIFTPDRDGEHTPAVIIDLRRRVALSEAIIICTPEYVFSPPAALKNFLEWMVSVTVLSDKPAALIVASGVGEKTIESLTLILDTLGVMTNHDTRVLIQGARSKMDDAGKFKDGASAALVDNCVSSLLKLIPPSN